MLLYEPVHHTNGFKQEKEGENAQEMVHERDKPKWEDFGWWELTYFVDFSSPASVSRCYPSPSFRIWGCATSRCLGQHCLHNHHRELIVCLIVWTSFSLFHLSKWGITSSRPPLFPFPSVLPQKLIQSRKRCRGHRTLVSFWIFASSPSSSPSSLRSHSLILFRNVKVVIMFVFWVIFTGI